MTVGSPKYKVVADELRRRIEDGTYAPSTQFPTEQDIEEMTWPWPEGISRVTVRGAIKELIAAGLIYVEHGRGTYVRRIERVNIYPQQEMRPQPDNPPRDRFMQQLTDEQRQQVNQTISVSMVPAPKHIAARLQLTPGDEIVARLRVIQVDGERVRTNDSYYPRDVVEGSSILDPCDIARGTNQVLTELGHEQVHRLNEMIARMPTLDEANRLQLPPGTPVAVLTVTGYDKNGRPVRCTENVLRGDRNTIVYEFDE